MKLTVKNFRGVKYAVVDIAPITIIGGTNHQGKSSILQAAAAACTGKIIPFDIPKKHASLIVHSGTASGLVKFESDNGLSEIKYPEAERQTEGSPVEISHTAAGLDSLVDTDIKNRAYILSELTKCMPSKKDLQDKLKNALQNTIDKIWQTIDIHGWDTAYNNEKSNGAKLKGAWEQITGTKYGSSKAGSWLPAAWESGLENKTEEWLKEQVDIYKTFYEKAKQNDAVDEAESDRLKNEVSKIKNLEKQLSDTNQSLKGLFKNESDINKQFRLMVDPASIKSVPCPHCGKQVQIVGGELKKAITDEERNKLQEKYDSCKESLDSIKEEIDRLNAVYNRLKSDISLARKAEEQLKKNASRKKDDGTGNIEECENRLNHAVNRLDAWRDKKEADKKHKEILDQADIVKALAPTGLRQEKVVEALTKINKSLKNICQVADWSTVEICDDMSIVMHGTPYCLLSSSEQYRVRTVLQLAVASIDKSPIVLIDAADILDSAGRLGLIKIVKTLGISAMLGMTYSNRSVDKETVIAKRKALIKDLLPDLSKLGGNRYWVENGECVEV